MTSLSSLVSPDLQVFNTKPDFVKKGRNGIGDFDFKLAREDMAFLQKNYQISLAESGYLLFLEKMSEDIAQISKILRWQLETACSFEMAIKTYRQKERDENHYCSYFYPYFHVVKSADTTEHIQSQFSHLLPLTRPQQYLYGYNKVVSENIYDMDEDILDDFSIHTHYSFGFLHYHPDSNSYHEHSIEKIEPERIAPFIRQFCDFYFQQYRGFTQMALEFAQKHVFPSDSMDNHYFEYFLQYSQEHSIKERLSDEYRFNQMNTQSDFMFLPHHEWKEWQKHNHHVNFQPLWVHTEFNNHGYVDKYARSRKINQTNYIHIYATIEKALHYLNYNRPKGYHLEDMVILELYINTEQKIKNLSYRHYLDHDVFHDGSWQALIKRVWQVSSYRQGTDCEVISCHYPGTPYAPASVFKKG